MPAATVVLNILAIVGTLSSIYTAFIVIRDKLGYYSWWSIESRSKYLIRKIKEEDYKPDMIIGLGRSGAILGGILSGNLGIIPITVVDRLYSWNQRNARTIEVLNFLQSEIISDKRILLVDAAPHTAETAKVIEESLLGMNPTEVRVASLYRTRNMLRIPDYYVKYEKQAKKMPWRFSEDFREDFAIR